MLPAAAHLPFYIVDHKLLFYSGDRYESTAMKRQMRAPRSAPHIKLCNTTTPLILGWQATDGDAPVVAPDQPAAVPFDREARPGHAHASHSSRRSSLSALVTRGSSHDHTRVGEAKLRRRLVVSRAGSAAPAAASAATRSSRRRCPCTIQLDSRQSGRVCAAERHRQSNGQARERRNAGDLCTAKGAMAAMHGRTARRVVARTAKPRLACTDARPSAAGAAPPGSRCVLRCMPSRTEPSRRSTARCAPRAARG